MKKKIEFISDRKVFYFRCKNNENISEIEFKSN